FPYPRQYVLFKVPLIARARFSDRAARSFLQLLYREAVADGVSMKSLRQMILCSSFFFLPPERAVFVYRVPVPDHTFLFHLAIIFRSSQFKEHRLKASGRKSYDCFAKRFSESRCGWRRGSARFRFRSHAGIRGRA